MTRKWMGLLTIAMGALLAMPASSWAWRKSGHRIVIMIAWKHMNADARKEISKILNGDNGTRITPVDVANWADDVRSDPRFDLLAPLHFVNSPKDVNDYNLIPEDKINPQGDLVQAIEALAVYLQKNDHTALASVKAFVALEASGVKIDREMALKLFVHFIGDLSQPLHFGYEEDHGGNKVSVEVMHRPGNLHAAWDDLLNNFQEYSSQEYSQYLNRQLSEANKKTWTEKDLYTMAAETMVLREKMYHFPDGFKTPVAPTDSAHALDSTHPVDPNAAQVAKIGYKYFYEMVPVLDNQLLKGGVVAASLLNKVFGSSAATAPPLFDLSRKRGVSTGSVSGIAGASCQYLFK